VILSKLTAQQFAKFSHDIHGETFGDSGLSDVEKIDYAIIMMSEDEEPIIWATIHEENKLVAYMQAGGSFNSSRAKTTAPYRAYCILMDWLTQRYSVITTRIENTNKSMLKCAISQGFVVQGMRSAGFKLLLELHKRGNIG